MLLMEKEYWEFLKIFSEVKNAYEAYEKMSTFNPYDLKNILKAHKIMMNGLVKEAGTFRSGNVGVYAGTQLIHAGTPAKYVPDLMKQLFEWLKNEIHPLVNHAVFIMSLNLFTHFKTAMEE